MRIAIIGSGVSGLTCAHLLGDRADTVLFEAASTLGGHANTVTVQDPQAGTLAVDTGFIVHNDRNYPNLVRLFDELNIETIDTEMSFAVTDRTTSFTYRATNLRTLFADPKSLVRPAMWRMLVDIIRFYRRAKSYLDSGRDDLSTAEFLVEGRYSKAFVDLHLIPMGAAVWSADPQTFDQFPAASLLQFLRNHGLLGVGDRPQWRALPNGSRRYVDAIAKQFAGEIRIDAPVRSVSRDDDSVVVVTDERHERFDQVILACHSNQALDLLTDPSAEERSVLGAIRYQPNRATLHTDTSLLSPKPSAWAAWNYDRLGPNDETAAVTYDLTTLQHLPGERRYLVSLNSDDRIDPSTVLGQYDYEHPIFDRSAIDAQARFNEISGVDRTHFCGAYWGFGFHEDGIVSGMRVCAALGVDW